MDFVIVFKPIQLKFIILDIINFIFCHATKYTKMMEFAKLKETYDTIAKAMVRGKEPSEELLAVTAFLDDVCASNGQVLVPADDLTEEE